MRYLVSQVSAHMCQKVERQHQAYRLHSEISLPPLRSDAHFYCRVTSGKARKYGLGSRAAIASGDLSPMRVAKDVPRF